MTDEPADPDEDTSMRDDTTTDLPAENIVHFNLGATSTMRLRRLTFSAMSRP